MQTTPLVWTGKSIDSYIVKLSRSKIITFARKEQNLSVVDFCHKTNNLSQSNNRFTSIDIQTAMLLECPHYPTELKLNEKECKTLASVLNLKEAVILQLFGCEEIKDKKIQEIIMHTAALQIDGSLTIEKQKELFIQLFIS